MRKHKNFWDKNAGRYDRFMRKDRAAYEEMYALIRPVVKAKTVLELATGTGLIAKHIVNAAAHIEATDASAEMIAEAKRDNRSAKLYFSVQDMFRLPYADKSFDVVIVSNALHIVPQPEKALAEIRRVLKDGGVLIAPQFEARKGMLGTTFGGNHLACAAAIAVADTIAAEGLVENARRVGDRLLERLRTLPALHDVRGRGLMIGFDVEGSASELRRRLVFEQHVFTGGAGAHTVRLLPALGLSEAQADEFVARLKALLEDFH